MEPVAEIQSVLSDLLGRTVTSIESIGSGRNSRVYKLACGSSVQFAAKFYLRHDGDYRDRLGVEFSSLRFLWEHGIRCIPRPVAANTDLGCAIYEYIEGSRISSQAVTDSDIAAAVQFLARLKNLTRSKSSDYVPLASEACFSAWAIFNNIELRLTRLQGTTEQYPMLRKFLNDDFLPSFYKIAEWSKSSFKAYGVPWEKDIGQAERTLSPSDFGFHNALRRNNGEIVFLDLEYFGWDDPAKMISDFLLHPAMELRESMKRQFVADILARLPDRKGLAKRVEVVYPLFGLKWCVILLNEFLPEHLLRRTFANGSDLNKAELQAQQLAKAKRMLQRMMSEYGHFPYSG